MDLHDYTLWLLLQDRHAEIVAAAQRDAWLRGATRPRRPFRAALGTALMRLGAWLLCEHHPAPAEPLGLSSSQQRHKVGRDGA